MAEPVEMKTPPQCPRRLWLDPREEEGTTLSGPNVRVDFFSETVFLVPLGAKGGDTLSLFPDSFTYTHIYFG